jgi:hypothetical protein
MVAWRCNYTAALLHQPEIQPTPFPGTDPAHRIRRDGQRSRQARFAAMRIGAIRAIASAAIPRQSHASRSDRSWTL